MDYISMCYWNRNVGVVVVGGLDNPDYVVALAEYCRLVELKNDSCGIHNVGRQFMVTANFLKYMGNEDSCDVVFTEDIFADIEYVIYEKYLEPHSLLDDSLIRIVADEFLLGVIDEAQPEEDRLGIDFIRDNMHTNKQYDTFESEDVPF